MKNPNIKSNNNLNIIREIFNNKGGTLLNKKIIIGILIIVLLLLVSSSIMMFSDKDHIKVENTKFKIPEGYTVTNADKYYNLTNGIDSICIEKKVGNLDLNTTIDHYLKIKKEENISTQVSNFTVDNLIVYKVNTKNSGACHYWYEDNGKVYSMFTLNKSPNIDPLVVSLINSKSNSIF